MYQTHVKDVADPTLWAQEHHLPELDCPPEERAQATATRLSVLAVVLDWYAQAPSPERLDLVAHAVGITDARVFRAIQWMHAVDMIRALQVRYGAIERRSREEEIHG